MPLNTRIRDNNVFGSTEDNPLTSSASSFNSLGLVNLSVIATNHAIITLDPLRQFGNPEIVVVTIHTAGSSIASITRGAYGTSPREHPQGTLWVHAPLDEDFIKITTSSSRPLDPYRGQMIFETDTDKFVARSVTDSWVDAVPLGAWQTWAPVLRQGAIVASTTQHATYTRIGRIIIAQFRLFATAAGTAGQTVEVTLPVTAAATATSKTAGNGWLIDISVATYVGSWMVGSPGTHISIITDSSTGSGNAWGVAPSVALASSDVMGATLMYEAVS